MGLAGARRAMKQKACRTGERIRVEKLSGDALCPLQGMVVTVLETLEITVAKTVRYAGAISPTLTTL